MHRTNATRRSPNQVVGIWRLKESLHQGQWTDIYCAQPAEAKGSPRADYAVKILTEPRDAQAEGRKQIENEASSLASTRHPNLIALLDAHIGGPAPFLVFPRLEGCTLSKLIVGSYNQPIPVCLWWIRQMAQALEALHRAGWAHSDVKPSNLIVSARGHVTLIDCGLAQPLGGSIEQGRFQGTPGYAAPELTRSRPVATAAADIYALGVLFHQVLSRRWVTQGDYCPSAADLEILGVHPPIVELISRMADTDPANRPTVKDLIDTVFRLEIECLGMHIQPEEPDAKAA